MSGVCKKAQGALSAGGYVRIPWWNRDHGTGLEE